MRRSKVLELLKIRLFVFVLLAGACKYCFGSCTSLLAVFVALLFVCYIIWEAITTRTPSSPVSKPVTNPTPDPPDDGLDLSRVVGQLADPGDKITQMSQQLDEMQGLLETHGDWAEKIGDAFLKSLERIHKKQRDQLRQHNDLGHDYDEKLGSVVNVLDDLRDETTEAARAAAENNTSLYNTIGQHRQDIENNQSAFQQYTSSVNTILLRQDRAIESVREDVAEHTGSFQLKLDGHAQTVEENKRLVKESGALINSVVSDHAQLIAEYQAVVDGMVSLNTANHVFSLVHTPYGWETLGDVAEGTNDRMGAQPGAQPASMVDSVQELSRAFRGTADQAAQASPLLMDQMIATVLSQVQETVQAQQAKETGQLLQAQEDIEKLRADLGEIEEFRRVIREREELEQEHEELVKRHKRQLEISEILKDDPERIRRDAGLRAEVDEITRWVNGKTAKAAAV